MSTLSRSLPSLVIATAMAALLPAAQASSPASSSSSSSSFASLSPDAIDADALVTFDVTAAPAPTPVLAPTPTPQVVTHCYWVCYPGSGCEYVCRSFPW